MFKTAPGGDFNPVALNNPSTPKDQRHRQYEEGAAPPHQVKAPLLATVLTIKLKGCRFFQLLRSEGV